MVLHPKIAQRCAEILFEIDAIHFKAKNPFKLTSGWASPVYIDCRKIISFPKQRDEIMAFAVDILTQNNIVDKMDLVAGGETAGIPYGAWLADRTEKPMLYVRKKPKGFGRMAQIEGAMAGQGENVLLVEDLTTDGASKIKFCNVLREAGANVTDVFSVFFYNIFAQSEALFKDAGLTLHYLTDWPSVLAVAREKKQFDQTVLDEVGNFIDNPALWSEKNGGVSIVSTSS